MIREEKDFEQMACKVLSSIGSPEKMGNVVQILNLPPAEYQVAFDLALEMQNRDLIKLLYAFEAANLISVEMTLVGKAYLEGLVK